MNRYGFFTLYRKEVMRFLKVSVQTVLAPVISAMLYLMIFSHLLEERLEVYPGISYGTFLVPGLVMMSMIQNAFANSSSSLIQSKMAGNIVFVLLAPISALEFFAAFTLAAISRALMVGVGVALVAAFFVEVTVPHPVWALVFSVLGAAFLGVLGIVAGISAEKYEHLAAFQNFVILPLSFLSGVFYSIHSLPGTWAAVSRFNPFFYIIDGFRYGFVGASDISPWTSLAVTSAFLVGVTAITIYLLNRGYKLRK
ncbi:MAG: ABC transporter permease [Gammaproteobacteria bacterium]